MVIHFRLSLNMELTFCEDMENETLLALHPNECHHLLGDYSLRLENY